MVMTALMVTVCFGMLALTVDIGFGLVQRRAAQNAADAAALAAAKLLAKSVDTDANGNVVWVDTNDSGVWSTSSPFFTANHVGGPLAPSFTTALGYLDCNKASLGFSSSSASALVTGTRLASGASVPSATCYVRTTSQVQFGSFFGRVIGRQNLTANAQATSRIAPTSMPSGQGTWPITRWLNGGAADCPFSDSSPCVFWANNGVSGSTAIGTFKELLDLSRYSPSTGLAQFASPSDYDHSWPGTSDKNNDMPHWLQYGWLGKMNIGDKVELFGGDLGNNNASTMTTYIINHSQGTSPSHPERGRYTTVVVYFWNSGETYNSHSNTWSTWNSHGGGAPDRVTISDSRCFRFYENLVNSSSISGYYVSCLNTSGTPLAGGPSKYANTVQMAD